VSRTCNATFIHLAAFLVALLPIPAFVITASVPTMILIVVGVYTLSNAQPACHHLPVILLLLLLLLLHLPQQMHLWPLSVSLLLHNAIREIRLCHLLKIEKRVVRFEKTYRIYSF
jgi:hypothetical protein